MDKLMPTIGNVQFQNPIFAGAGNCKYYGSEFSDMLNSSASAIVVGGFTVEPREGNGGEVLHIESNAGFTSSHNSLGLPNRGLEQVAKDLPKMVADAHAAGKVIIANLNGSKPDDYYKLATMAVASGVDMVELNLSCSNKWTNNVQERIACFDTKTVTEILLVMQHVFTSNDAIAVKVSPYSDPFQLQEIAHIFNRFAFVRAVTTMNTFPNSYVVDENGKPRITANGGLAGMGGPATKPMGLGQVKQFKEHLRPEIAVIGAGGITTGRDAWEYLYCAGATAVQVVTGYCQYGRGIFHTILSELVELVLIHDHTVV